MNRKRWGGGDGAIDGPQFSSHDCDCRKNILKLSVMHTKDKARPGFVICEGQHKDWKSLIWVHLIINSI